MKTEEEARTLLRDAARAYETAPPPTPMLIDLGRRARKRRLAWIAGGATASILLTAALGGAVVSLGNRLGSVGPVHGGDNGSPDVGGSRMPSVIGWDKQEATDSLTAIDLRGGTEVDWDERTTTSCDEVGTVVDQDPAPGDRLTSSVPMILTIGVPAQPYMCDVDVPLADRRIAQAFAAFADDMGRNHFPPAGAPFAREVALGIGNEYRRTITRAETTDPDQWRLLVDGYATAHGRFSAIDEVDARLEYTELTTDMSPSSCTVTRVDSPPLELTGGGRSVRIRNTATSSCWDEWFVDIYINDVGQVVGVSLTLGVPEDMQKGS